MPHNTSSVYLAAPSLDVLQNMLKYDSISKLMDTNWNATSAQLPTWLPDTYVSSYRQLLGMQISVTVTAIYISLAFWGNNVNQRRGYRRWAWRESRIFHVLLLLHNASVAIFSIAVFFSAALVIYRGLPKSMSPDYGAQLADYLCRVQAPLWTTGDEWRGLWSEFGSIGEIFCLSKYYQLLDSAIIFAGGRRLSNLHVFHHAGIIVCACLIWQLASPHAVIGLILNSATHSLLYSYYLLDTLHIRGPLAVKKWLTILEIVQFVLGWLIACGYNFIQYDAPPFSIERLHINRNNESTKVPCIGNRAHLLVPILGGFVYLFPLTYLLICFYATAYQK